MAINYNCDNCNCDLTNSDCVTVHRLVLSCETCPYVGSVTLDILILPPINRTKYFCGLVCLKQWINK